MGFIRCILALLLIISAFPTEARNTSLYTFAVLMDGTPIGDHRVAVSQAQGRIEVEAATSLVVRAAFIPVFRFEHQRREIWEDGRPVHISAKTNDDGKQLDIIVRQDKGGYVRSVNGRIDRFDDSVKVMSLWNQDVINHKRFVSVILDKTIDVTFQYLGRESLDLGDETVKADHYRMVGNDRRDIWYDDRGQVLKVEFERGGSEIEYVRRDAAPGTGANGLDHPDGSDYPKETY